MTAPYLRTLILRSWWRIALCAVFVGLGVLAASYFIFPVYESTAYVQVVINASDSVFVADRIGHNEAILATSPGVLEYAAKRNPPLSASRLKSKVSVILEPNSHLVGITVQDTNPTRAASVANDIAAALVVDQAESVQAANTAAQQPTLQLIAATRKQITQTQSQLASLGTPPSNPTQAAALQTQLTTLQGQLTQEQSALQQLQTTQGASSIYLTVAQKAVPSPAPLTTRMVEYTAAGVIGGALLGLLLVLALDWLNWQVRSSAAVQTLLGANVLGEVSQGAIADADGRVTEVTYSAALGAYQSLARALDFSGVDTPLRTVALLSPERAAASQQLASGLAIYLASNGRRTLLVDGYLVTGRQARQFGVPSAPGLSDAALADRSANRTETPALITYAHTPTTLPAPTLLVASGGTPPPNPDQVLASQAMDRTLAALPTSGADIVVFDSPPLLGRVGLTAGARAFLKHADGAFLVVDLSQTRKDHLLRAQNALAEAGTPVLGCIVVGPAGPAPIGARPMWDAPSALSAPTRAPSIGDPPPVRRTRWAPEASPTGREASPAPRAAPAPFAPTTGAPIASGPLPPNEAPGGSGPLATHQETTLRLGRPRAPHSAP